VSILPTLESTAQALLSFHKGILAADESIPTIEKRFREYAIPPTEEYRRAYREMLLTTPVLNEYINGVILFDETIRQRTKTGIPFPAVLEQQDMLTGIKVDQGTIALTNSPNEKVTQGLEGLAERLVEYRELGARFTKWRAVMVMGEHLPTRPCMEANADALAQFAKISQEAGLVPIVEPEIIMDGVHTLAQCEGATHETLECVFGALAEQGVGLGQMLLKTNMIVSGAECPEQANLVEVATATLRCLRHAVPTEVAGIVFLSGGQSEEQATQRLNAICRLGHAPWKLSFSFGRALQSSALKIWQGNPANVAKAQAALYQRAKCNSLAVRGEYPEPGKLSLRTLLKSAHVAADESLTHAVG
jgi:fructose-bisphosphate aldolase class I